MNYKHPSLGKGEVEGKLKDWPGLVEPMKDAKPGGNLTVDFWQREEKKKSFDYVCIEEKSVSYKRV